jgi:hypothetical protein
MRACSATWEDLGRLLAMREDWTCVKKDLGDPVEYAQVREAFELTRTGAFQRRGADHGGFRMQLLQVFDDGERFRQARAIVQLEHRQRAQRVFGEKLGRLIFAFAQIDPHQGNRHAFLRQIDAQLVRIGREREVKDSHVLVVLKPT